MCSPLADALFRVLPFTPNNAERDYADYVSLVNAGCGAAAAPSDAVKLAAQFLEVRDVLLAWWWFVRVCSGVQLRSGSRVWVLLARLSPAAVVLTWDATDRLCRGVVTPLAHY